MWTKENERTMVFCLQLVTLKGVVERLNARNKGLSARLYIMLLFTKEELRGWGVEKEENRRVHRHLFARTDLE